MKTKNLKTKTMSILLAVIMLLGIMPTTVSAANETVTVTVSAGGTSVTMTPSVEYEITDDSLTLKEPYDYVFEGEKLELSLIVANNEATVIGGAFRNTVKNEGRIKGGTFDGTVTNNGIFAEGVLVGGIITGGTFNAGILNYGGTVPSGVKCANVGNLGLTTRNLGSDSISVRQNGMVIPENSGKAGESYNVISEDPTAIIGLYMLTEDETVPTENFVIEDIFSAVAAGFAGYDFIMPNEAVTIVAVFNDYNSTKTYTVTYDSNGGSGSMENGTATSDTEFTLPSCGFTPPSGKQFKAWEIDGVEYNAGETYTFVANTTVKAIWDDIPELTAPVAPALSYNYLNNSLEASFEVDENAVAYEYELYLNDETTPVKVGEIELYGDATEHIVFEQALEEGVTYKCRIRALGVIADIHSEWSDFSAYTHYNYEPIVVGNALLMYGDKYEIDADSYVVYEGEKGNAVLRLVNFSYATDDIDDIEFLPMEDGDGADRRAVIYTHLDDLEIVLEGTNTLTFGRGNFSLIYCDGNLTISSATNGKLSLYTEAVNVDGIHADMITVKNCELIITTTAACMSTNYDYIEFVGCEVTLTTSSQDSQAIPYFGAEVVFSGCIAVAGEDKDNTEPVERIKSHYKYIKVYVPDSFLDAPQNLNISGTFVSWDAVEGAYGYEIEYYGKYETDNEFDLEGDAEVPGTQTSYRFDSVGMSSDWKYYFRVRALGNGDNVGSSEWAESELYEVGDFFIAGIDLKDGQYLYNDGTLRTTAPNDSDMGYAYYEEGETNKLTLSNFNLASYSNLIQSFIYSTRALEVKLIGDNVFASEESPFYMAFEIDIPYSSQLPIGPSITPLPPKLMITGEADSTLTTYADEFAACWSSVLDIIIDEPVTVKTTGTVTPDYLEVNGSLYVDFGIYLYGGLVRGENGYISVQLPASEEYGAFEIYSYDDPATSEYDIDDYLELNGGEIVDGDGNDLVSGYYVIPDEYDNYYWYAFFAPSVPVAEHSAENAAHNVIIRSASADKPVYAVEVDYNELWGTVSGAGNYEQNSLVTLTATPAEDTEFQYWLDASADLGDYTEAELRDAIVSYDATYTFAATQNVSLKAVFYIAGEYEIIPMLIDGTDSDSLFEVQMWEVDYDFGSITPGSEEIVLPGDILEDIVTIGDKQYQFKGFILFGYDETSDTETVELKETMTIGSMPLYDSAEYWDWFTPFSDGIYAAYMEYIPDENNDDEPQKPGSPTAPAVPQKPSAPEQPDGTKTSSSPLTGDNSHIALWITLLLVSGGAVTTLTVIDKKKRDIE